jgi:deoxyinosine 3'endonuclease (endonuclease V)
VSISDLLFDQQKVQFRTGRNIVPKNNFDRISFAVGVDVADGGASVD